MRVLKALWGVGLAAALAIGLLLSITGAALAAGGTSLCIPEGANQATLTPTGGTCNTGYKLTELGAEGKEGKLSGLSEAEIKTLDEVLPHMKFVKEGVDKKPTSFTQRRIQAVQRDRRRMQHPPHRPVMAAERAGLGEHGLRVQTPR